MSALGSLGRRGRGEKREYTESASRYLGEVYREYVADMETTETRRWVYEVSMKFP